MKRIICLILVLASLFSFTSCGKKQERSELALDMAKEAVWIVEAVAGVTIKDIICVESFGDSSKYGDDTYRLAFSDTNDCVHSIFCSYLNRSDDESEKLLVEYYGDFREAFSYYLFDTNESVPPSVYIKNFKSRQNVDIEWINSELHNYKNQSDSKIESVKKIMRRSSSFLECIEENDLVTLDEKGSVQNSGWTVYEFLRYAQKLWDSLTETERENVDHDYTVGRYCKDPLYRCASIIACKVVIPSIKEDLVNPASLQVNSQTVKFYKNYTDDDKIDYAVVESDCSSQNGFGGYTRSSITKIVCFNWLRTDGYFTNYCSSYLDPSEVKTKYPRTNDEIYTYSYVQ